MIARHIIADDTTLIFSLSEQNIDRGQIAYRGLSIKIEFAQRIDFVAKKFQSHRKGRLPRIEIDNATTDGELPACSDLSDAFITNGRELFDEMFHLRVRSAPKLSDSGLEHIAAWRCLIETCTRCDDQMGPGPALDLRKQREPFGCHFWIGQNVFDGGKLGFRQEKRVRMPVQQALVNQFLRMNVGTEDPNCLVDPMGDGGGEKRLRRLSDMWELHRPLRYLVCAKFARDRLAPPHQL